MTSLSHPGFSNGLSRCALPLAVTIRPPAIPDEPAPFSDNALIRPPGSTQQCFQFVDNRAQLRRGQLWVHRQGQELFGTPFGDGKRPLSVPQKTIRLLQMNGNGVMNAAGNSSVCHRLQDPLPVLHAHYVKVVNVTSVLSLCGQDHFLNLGQMLVVKPGVGSSCLVGSIQVLQFHPKSGALDSIHPRIPTTQSMVIFL